MSDIIDHPTQPTTDPYAEATAALAISPMDQALLVMGIVTYLAGYTELCEHGPISELEEARLHAIVHVGFSFIPTRDFVMSTIASFDDEQDWKPLMLALGACAGSAPEEYRGHVASAAAMLGCALGVSEYVIHHFLSLDTGTSLAQLVRNGLAMKAPAALYRGSMQQALPSILTQLESA